MPQLDHIKKTIGNPRGSVLVGVVAFSILMAIAAGGYMNLTGSTVNHEVAALDEDKALYAAESGLLVGGRWLRDSTNWHGLTTGTVNVFDTVINGMTVDVDVIKNAVGDVEVRSTAHGGTIKYEKQLSWSAYVKNFRAGTVINSMNAYAKGDGFINTVFDGPFHMNTNIVFDQNSNPGSETEVKFVNGLVTVYSPDHGTDFLKSDPLGTGDHGGYGNGAYNNYDYGVYHPNYKVGDPHGSDLDQYFTNEYKHSQDSIYLDVAFTNRKDLPVSEADPNVRPTLEFLSGGGAKYTYKAGGSWTTTTYGAGDINDKILVTGQDVNVLGTVNGQVSLGTENGGSVYVVGELMYANNYDPVAHDADYDSYDNSNNYGLSGTDALAVVSDNDILFPSYWTDPTDGTEKDFAMDGIGGTVDAYVTGMLLAKDQINWEFKKTSNEYPMKEMRFLGARSLEAWGPKFFETGNALDMKFLFDTRLEDGLLGAGIGITVKTKEGSYPLLVLETAWNESNNPL